jgi:prepilin-type N-terminal cleavage/methylation domain-containing protein
LYGFGLEAAMIKRKSSFKQHHNTRSFFFRWHLRKEKSIQFSDRGFTLIEMLVAGVISTVVILVAWSGLVSAMNMSQEAQARSERQSELNKALDFMTNEIRMARSINASSTLIANGTTVTLPNVVTSAGVNLTSLGSYGTLGLYLERPTAPNIPAICPVGGPNAGAPPPTPADFDPVVYDIRPSPSGWLQPRMVARYGRVPAADGTINPCSSPVSSDPMIDALSTTRSSAPTCSGVLSGSGGFYSCVTGKQVDLFFQSNISQVEARQVSTAVSSRVLDIQPQTLAATECPRESTLRSKPGGKSSTITFVNKRTTTVKVYWLDTNGARVYYFDLAPNGTRNQNTIDKNHWVVTDSSQACVDIFVAKKNNTTATIQ